MSTRPESPSGRGRPEPLAPVAPGTTARWVSPTPAGGDSGPRAAWRRDRSGSSLPWRTAFGSLGLVLALGVWLGRASGPEVSAPPGLRISGAGHLLSRSPDALIGPVGPLTDAASVRDRIHATGVPEAVRVERVGTRGLRVEVVEKRAAALLAGDPPIALAGDGTVLGPATAADLDFAGAEDLVVIRGIGPEATGARTPAALAGELAAGLRERPALDRLVSELDFSAGPYRIEAVLRTSPITVLLTGEDFFDQLALAVRLLPTLEARWPDLARVDARVPDRLLLSMRMPETGSAR